MSAHGHMRFVGGTTYCPTARARVDLGPDHGYDDAYTCPGCGEHVDWAGEYAKWVRSVARSRAGWPGAALFLLALATIFAAAAFIAYRDLQHIGVLP